MCRSVSIDAEGREHVIWDDQHRFAVDPDPGDGTTNGIAVLALVEHYRTHHIHEMKNQVRSFRSDLREDLAGWPQEREKMLDEIETGLWRLTMWNRPARKQLEQVMEERKKLNQENKCLPR